MTTHSNTWQHITLLISFSFLHDSLNLSRPKLKFNCTACNTYSRHKRLRLLQRAQLNLAVSVTGITLDCYSISAMTTPETLSGTLMSDVGDRITFDGQRYHCVAVQVFPESASGPAYPSSLWRSVCAQAGCDRSFQVTWPLNFPRRGVTFQRRCDAHKNQRDRVNPATRSSTSTTYVTKQAQEYVKDMLDSGEMTVTEMVKECERTYDDLTPSVAARLGSKAASDHRRQYVHRVIGPMLKNKDIIKHEGKFYMPYHFNKSKK